MAEGSQTAASWTQTAYGKRIEGLAPQDFSFRELFYYFRVILGPESRYFWLAIIYGIAISVLTLAVPLSVQMLIDTVANTALLQPLLVLSGVLFGLLIISGILSALRTHLMELFGRRIYARLVSDFSLHAVYAHAPFFEESKRDVLFHRYFDIMTLQRNIPELLIGAFAIFFQAVIGFTVVSLYHPVFLAFNLALIFLIILVWQIWGPSAIRTGIDLSRAKYEAAKWLDHLGDANSMYKADTHIDYALQRTEGLTASYIHEEKRHFRRTFAQTISLLFLYALASALLLGVGGWLVIQGQLSLGQLVAAELIMSAIFVGMSQFDQYLRRFYFVCMAVDEISLIYKIPLEKTDGRLVPEDTPCDLRFANVHRTTRNREAVFDVTIPCGAKVRAEAEAEVLQRMFHNLLKRNETPDHGYITLGGIDLTECDIHRLRQDVMVKSRPTIMDCTIADYLQLSGAQEATRGEMYEMLRLVGIDEVVRELDDGLDTVLSPLGLPLSTEETLRMKLAAALWAKPRVLVVGEAFDLIERPVWDSVMDHVRDRTDMTFVFFTRYHDLPHFDHKLFLGWQRQDLSYIEEADPIAAK